MRSSQIGPPARSPRIGGEGMPVGSDSFNVCAQSQQGHAQVGMRRAMARAVGYDTLKAVSGSRQPVLVKPGQPRLQRASV
jgi:hypothetical protein